MDRITLLLIALFLLIGSFGAEGKVLSDTIFTVKDKGVPRFLALNGMGGIVIPTNEFVQGDRVPFYGSAAIKYGIYSTGDSWEDFAYGMPYYGVGVYTAQFTKRLGTPVSLFLFHGGDLKRFSPKWSLKYELNLGMAFNWKSYDRFDNPNNVALGSTTNAHVGANVYMKKNLSPHWDLNFGLGLTHFSNGAQRLPNKGVNMFAPFVELVYNLEPVSLSAGSATGSQKPPFFGKRVDYDLMLTITSRQILQDTTGTGRPTPQIDRNFKVFGLNYAAMFVSSYKYKWGPSLELMYDEGSGVQAWRQMHPDDGKIYDRVKMGSFSKRFSIGLSAKGEMTFQHVSFFANIGYNLLHGNTYDFRTYQIIGAKAYLKDNLFGVFGIRATHFSKAQYLYWSIGYTIRGKAVGNKDKLLNRIVPL